MKRVIDDEELPLPDGAVGSCANGYCPVPLEAEEPLTHKDAEDAGAEADEGRR